MSDRMPILIVVAALAWIAGMASGGTARADAPASSWRRDRCMDVSNLLFPRYVRQTEPISKVGWGDLPASIRPRPNPPCGRRADERGVRRRRPRRFAARFRADS